MLRLNTMKAVREQAPEVVWLETKNFVDQTIAEMGQKEFFEEFPNPDEAEDLLSYLMGGDVMLIETEEDLKQIDVLRGVDANGNFIELLDQNAVRSANVAEASCGFDAAHYLVTEDFAVLFTATNDAGGDVYYIPRAIADKYPTVEASIKESNEGGIMYTSTRPEHKANCRIVAADGTVTLLEKEES